MILHVAEGLELVVRGNPQPAVSLRGELDLCTAPRILPHLIEAADRADTSLVVDLAETSFLDCRGLAALIAVRDALRSRDRRLQLRGAEGIVRKILAMSELADLLDDRPDQAVDKRDWPEPLGEGRNGSRSAGKGPCEHLTFLVPAVRRW